MTGKCMVNEVKIVEKQKVIEISVTDPSMVKPSQAATISAPLPIYGPILPSNFVEQDSNPCL